MGGKVSSEGERWKEKDGRWEVGFDRKLAPNAVVPHSKETLGKTRILKHQGKVKEALDLSLKGEICLQKQEVSTALYRDQSGQSPSAETVNVGHPEACSDGREDLFSSTLLQQLPSWTLP